jgi:hypothetical protein
MSQNGVSEGMILESKGDKSPQPIAFQIKLVNSRDSSWWAIEVELNEVTGKPQYTQHLFSG